MKLITCPETAHLEAIDCLVEHNGDVLLVLRCSRFDPPEAVECSMLCVDRMNRRRACERAEATGPEEAAGPGYKVVT